MKSIHSSIYRVRSNSLSSSHRQLHTNNILPLSFFDSPPPPLSSRPGILTSPNRLPTENSNPNSSTQQPSQTQASHLPFSLALGATPSSNSSPQSQYPLFPYSSSQSSTSPHYHPKKSTSDAPLRAHKRQRLKYQLDVGAYGIPKRSKSPSLRRGIHTRLSPSPPSEDLNLAVQVGEDAYFVRDNAMGVADGVGGWSKSKHQPDVLQPTPSALFARRLMHFCSAEVETATSSKLTSSMPPVAAKPSRTQFSFQHHLKPRSNPIPIFTSASSPWSWNEAEDLCLRQEELEQDLEDSLDELSEGIDVLQILESAYDQTIKAHVVPPSSATPPLSATQSKADPISRSTAQHPLPIHSLSFSSALPKTIAEPTPLLSGSSTALLAVLDHAPGQAVVSSHSEPSLANSPSSSTPPPSSPSSAPAASTLFKHPSIINYAAGTLHPSLSAGNSDHQPSTEAGTCDAVIRIAHIGDCMGMLVRGEEIVWRSEEMWWAFNMPLQLGPMTHPTVTPSNSAHYFTLPVRADDILILASDGLSDNLWDEEVLDEVIKFRQSFLDSSTPKEPEKPQPESRKPNAKTFPGTKSTSGNDADRLLRRKALAGMLSEALCSRARKVSERRWSPRPGAMAKGTSSGVDMSGLEDGLEVPFARRAREAGKVFRGGKRDDISVIVAVISPAENGEVVLGKETA